MLESIWWQHAAKPWLFLICPLTRGFTKVALNWCERASRLLCLYVAISKQNLLDRSSKTGAKITMERVNSPYFECKRSYIPTTGRHHAKCIRAFRCDIKQPHALLHPRTNNKTGRLYELHSALPRCAFHRRQLVRRCQTAQGGGRRCQDHRRASQSDESCRTESCTPITDGVSCLLSSSSRGISLATATVVTHA